jgi:serine/threonine protein kinase
MSKVFTITEGLENLGALRTGGQGSVYKGRRMGPVITAIKLLPTPIYTESEEDKNFRNFKSEVAKLEKVNEEPNPNVVKILSWGLSDSGSFPFIEMEYIEGPDLCELLQPPHEKIFKLMEVVRVASQLANALAHCHKVGVKHGDIKSNNVKYNIHTGNYVLLDFGLAIMTEEQRRTSIRHAGAIEFMAPEQHDGQMLLQTDIYSYGVILYELLTGEVPFPLYGNGETWRNSVMLAHLEAEVPNLLEKRKANMPYGWPDQEMQVPAWLLNVIERCLQKVPEKRYCSGIELQEAIVSGSLAAAAGTQGELNTAEIRAENERLQALVMQYQQADAENEKQLVSLKSIAIAAGGRFNDSKGVYEKGDSVINLSKRSFIGLVGFAALFAVLFFYVLVSNKAPINTTLASTDTIAAKAYRSPYVFIKRINADSLLKAREKPVVKKVTPRYKRPAVMVTEQPKKKKKRKKFLGIF